MSRQVIKLHCSRRCLQISGILHGTVVAALLLVPFITEFTTAYYMLLLLPLIAAEGHRSQWRIRQQCGKVVLHHDGVWEYQAHHWSVQRYLLLPQPLLVDLRNSSGHSLRLCPFRDSMSETEWRTVRRSLLSLHGKQSGP